MEIITAYILTHGSFLAFFLVGLVWYCMRGAR